MTEASHLYGLSKSAKAHVLPVQLPSPRLQRLIPQ